MSFDFIGNSIDKALYILNNFNNPQKSINNVIHIAGTNGKGSTARFIQAILIQSGFSVNLYTSPHLVNINERFNLCGKNIDNETLTAITNEVQCVASKLNISLVQFELLTITAIILFYRYKADFNIFEVGIGGRYDTTNVFSKKLASVITSISLDHTDILGNNIASIAYHKSGIIQENDVVFTSCTDQIALQQIYQEVLRTNSKFFCNGVNWRYSSVISSSNINSIFDYHNVDNSLYDIQNLTSNLKGEHQFQNAALAIAVCQYIATLDDRCKRNISSSNIKIGVQNTTWNGRIEKIFIKGAQNSELILDGAHNEDGINVLCTYLNSSRKHFVKTIGIFACLDTKDIASFAKHMYNSFDLVYVTQIDNINSSKIFANKEEIVKILTLHKINAIILPALTLKNIAQIANQFEKLRLVFFGSLYFVGYVKKYFSL